jgi:hypothetical protein
MIASETETSDRVCTALTQCAPNEFEFIAPTATTDRTCLKGKAVNMTGHQGQTCFLADDQDQHHGIGTDYRQNVIWCNNNKKDGTVATPSQFGLVSEDLDFSLSTGGVKPVKLTADGKFCRLNFHDRRRGSPHGGTDGRSRITCDVDDSSQADTFKIGKTGGDKFYLQDNTNSYCELGYGIRCKFRRNITSGGKFGFSER